MIAVAQRSKVVQSTTWQEGFLKMLPLIEEYARAAFRGLDPEAHEEAVGEVVANALYAYQRLHERGEIERAFASALVRYAAAQYRAGRRVGTRQCTGDVYARQAKRGYRQTYVAASGEHGQWRECLVDDRRTPVPDQVAFRIDFPNWLDRQTERARRIAQRRSLSYTTSEVAREFEVSPARISQLRRELADSWNAYVNGAVERAS